MEYTNLGRTGPRGPYDEMGSGPNDRGLSARHIAMAYDDSPRALTRTLDDARLAAVDNLFPPVGKGGPGAWAW